MTSLYNRLNEIVKRYESDILIIQKFVNSTHDTLENLSEIIAEHKGNITNKDREVIAEVRDFLQETLNWMEQPERRVSRKTIQTTTRASQIVVTLATNIKHQEHFPKMALSYIMSFQEGFVKDYLEVVLSNRPELRKSSKSLSYEDAVGFSSIADLRAHLARNETDALGYRSIDDFGVYLETRFNVTIQQESFWPSLREASYRRNLLIHNRGIVNERYISKINPEKSQVKLETDRKYVIGVSCRIVEFMRFMHNSITHKLKLRKREPSRQI